MAPKKGSQAAVVLKLARAELRQLGRAPREEESERLSGRGSLGLSEASSGALPEGVSQCEEALRALRVHAGMAALPSRAAKQAITVAIMLWLLS